MDSGLSSVDWGNLPAEILAIIIHGGDLNNSPAEIVRFRSVCRWWRLSIPPPPNKISILFPLRPAVFGKSQSRYDFVIDASAVYLVRSRSDPSKACLVSVHEASAGSLVLRDPLVNKQIFNSPIDAYWIVATQTLISRSYAHNEICYYCPQILGTRKVHFVAPDPGSGGMEFVGVCSYIGGNMFAFRTDLIGRATTSSSLASHQLHREFFYGDAVTFNGRIIAVDYKGSIYTLDHTSLNLIQLNSVANIPNTSNRQYLVVSDGDLYLVSISYGDSFDPPPLCRTHRLVISTVDDDDDPPRRRDSLAVEKVEDLGGDGDRVFFITMKGSFSVSARHLPPPWKGNCIVYRHMASAMCECSSTACPPVYPDYKPNPEIFFLEGGGQNPRHAFISSLQGYSDLISPGPLLLQINDLDRKAGLME